MPDFWSILWALAIDKISGVIFHDQKSIDLMALVLYHNYNGNECVKYRNPFSSHKYIG